MKALLLASLALFALQQTRDARSVAPVTGSGEISGVVVNDDAAAQPIRRAIVTISGGALTTSRTAITDDAGRFVINNLPAGRVTVTAVKSPYLSASYGARRPGRPGTEVSIADRQRVAITIRMTRGAVITGTLRNADGQPVAGAMVRVIDPRKVDVRGQTPPAPVFTDARGVYRIFGLAAGEYLVMSSPRRLPGQGEVGHRSDADTDALFAQLAQRANRTATVMPSAVNPPGTTGATDAPRVPPAPPVLFAPIYYPGSPSFGGAATIKVAAGEERAGIDFVVAAVPVTSIEGTVLSGTGQSLGPIQISITPEGPSSNTYAGANPVLSVAPGVDGHFKFTNIVPGRYAIMARSRPGDTPAPTTTMRGLGGAPPAPLAAPGESLYAGEVVDVTGVPITGLTLSLVRGSKLAGSIVFQSTSLAPPADITALQMQIGPPRGTWYTMSNGTIIGNTFNAVFPVYAKADRTFELINIAPGRYAFSCTLPASFVKGWSLRSAMLNGRDLLDAAFDVPAGTDLRGVVVTFSDQHTELGGTLQTTAGQAAPDYFVVALPADRTLWQPGSRRILSTRPATDGAFVLRDLPPGDYLLAALTDVEPDDLNDLTFLEQLVPAALPVSLRDGEKKTQNLRVRGGSGF